ncbi:MAG: nuclear transport factor 2 family protein [Gammaproteobacteria bacterium]|nr:nuclear transport factor 2 family protein [Gammaproteobacteria bacterium]MDP2140474.1 nuclear transport factor 2 family protein [Gammaproteobacteria bacterium]MDP2349513.1 nuclear transport factor 2 family protein [Gammaproteobacteria bacterium]
MTNDFAQTFAQEWIDAWNAHDLALILSHYEDDFEMSSPIIRTLMNEPSGTLQGKSAVGGYWKLALERTPDLHFELQSILVGANSITLTYQGPRGLSAEVFHFAPSGKVAKAFAHYVISMKTSQGIRDT